MISWNLIIRNCSKSYRWFHMTFISQSHALKNISFEVLSKYLDVNKVSHFQLLRLHFFKKMHVGFHNSICRVFPANETQAEEKEKTLLGSFLPKLYYFQRLITFPQIFLANLPFQEEFSKMSKNRLCFWKSFHVPNVYFSWQLSRSNC